MNVPSITMLICIGLAATAAAQHAPSGEAKSPGASSKASLSEIRALAHELQGRTEKLSDLMEQYRSLMEQRPQAQGGSPEAKKASDEQLAKWNAALERLLRRLEAAHASVVETMQALERSATGQLPTALAKDVANARNEAGAQRTAAEQALAKSKAAPVRSSKRAAQKPAPEQARPPIPDDL